MPLATAEKLEQHSADDVPTRLIETAIKLYGERGCHAVSAREIIREAGVLNEAAVRYYFGNKQDLLEACLTSISGEIAPLMQRRWNELDARKPTNSGGRQIEVRDVVTAVLGGMIELQFQHASAMQLIARMIREEGANGQDLLIKAMKATIWRFEKELASVLPRKSAKALRLHTFLAINSILNGLVDQRLLNRLPATDSNAEFYQLEPNELMQGFIDYVSAGISSASNI